MPRGFFHQSEIISRAPAAKKPQCGKCRLHAECQTPMNFVVGEGRKGIFFVSNQPSQADDAGGNLFTSGSNGQPFVSSLKKVLKAEGIDLYKDCWVGNALACHPQTDLSDKELKKAIDYCRPGIINAIKDKKPGVVITLGQAALSSVVGYYYKKPTGSIKTWERFQIPCRDGNMWLCPLPHAGRRDDKPVDMEWSWFEAGLRSALSITARPWLCDTEIPDYRAQVEVIINHSDAAEVIREMSRSKRPMAFDYECNMLKPDGRDASILCASISDGERTIAFPFHGDVVEAFTTFVRCKAPKIASNLKFEERWTRRHLKVRVRNWKWDTMLAAHVLDNRPDITSLKFQSFVVLGQETYNSQIESLLQSDSTRTPNQAKSEISQHQLCTYCGLDSLLEWLLAQYQSSHLGVSLWK